MDLIQNTIKYNSFISILSIIKPQHGYSDQQQNKICRISPLTLISYTYKNSVNHKKNRWSLQQQSQARSISFYRFGLYYLLSTIYRISICIRILKLTFRLQISLNILHLGLHIPSSYAQQFNKINFAQHNPTFFCTATRITCPLTTIQISASSKIYIYIYILF